MVEAINQGSCQSCGNSDDNYSIESRDFDERPQRNEDGIIYQVQCECGETGSIYMNESGIIARGISHEEASWNQG